MQRKLLWCGTALLSAALLITGGALTQEAEEEAQQEEEAPDEEAPDEEAPPEAEAGAHWARSSSRNPPFSADPSKRRFLPTVGYAPLRERNDRYQFLPFQTVS